MRDLMILSSIFIFWACYGVMVYAMAQDPSLTELSLPANASYIIPGNMSSMDNDSNEYSIPIFQDSYESKSKSSLKIITNIATFGISAIPGMPGIIIGIVSIFNYFLFLMSILIVYRLIRHGGG